MGDDAVVRARTTDEHGNVWTSTTYVADVRRDPSRPLWPHILQFMSGLQATG